MEHCWDQV